MKETTRQLILLIGVLVLLTSSVVVINMADTGEKELEEPPEANNTQSNESSNVTEPETIIGKSIRGYQIMIGDIEDAMGMTSSDTPERP